MPVLKMTGQFQHAATLIELVGTKIAKKVVEDGSTVRFQGETARRPRTRTPQVDAEPDGRSEVTSRFWSNISDFCNLTPDFGATSNSMNILQHTADELACKVSQVKAAVSPLDEGATVPFISRYRKEATGGLDDTQIRDI